MEKAYFYERLTRWQHLHFSNVVLRERPETPAWEKQYEIYIQDMSRTAAQLFIRTTLPGEDTGVVMEKYLRWLNDYNSRSGDFADSHTATLPVPHTSSRSLHLVQAAGR